MQKQRRLCGHHTGHAPEFHQQTGIAIDHDDGALGMRQRQAQTQPGGAAHQGYRADAARQSLSGLCIDLVQGKHGAHGGNHHGIVGARLRNRQASF